MTNVSAATVKHERVVVSGYVFAKIIHEASKSENDTEGLLYGNITQTTSDRITDNDADGNHHEVEFALFDIIPSSKTFSFYDQVGKISLDRKNMPNSKALLGWYKVRRNSSSRISMREKAVIKGLIEELDMIDGLIFILFTPQSQANRSTTSFTYKCFYCQKDTKASLGLKVNIVNLGHTGTHPEYRHRSCLVEPPRLIGKEANDDMMIASTLPLICESYENAFVQEDGTVYEVHHTRKMYEKTMELLKKFQEDLTDKENEIADYEKEICRLRQVISSSKVDESSEVKNEESLQNGRDQQDDSSARHALSRLKLENDIEILSDND
ncbi:BRISC complex subunit Abraxas 2-like [Rhopilema esculentum]|uniref:BRISC complex subunit Abraxas 2-like n=1 Tax=Rhopilema esculentum TaxID=499914 RepID=UPI0031E0D85A